LNNYCKIKTFSPFTYTYVFIDSDAHLADQLFVRNGVPVKFIGEYVREKSQYKIIICKIRKKYEDSFLKSLSEMFNKALLLGYRDYSEYCQSFNEMIESSAKA